MDAITTAARTSGMSIMGSNLYCTTFPCHHCARHIVASGIKRIYYIEPYEKSLALKLHSDSISFEKYAETADQKTQILPFEGVAPRRYLHLFSADDRKGRQDLLTTDLSEAKPALIKLTDTYFYYEGKILENLKEIDENLIDMIPDA